MKLMRIFAGLNSVVSTIMIWLVFLNLWEPNLHTISIIACTGQAVAWGAFAFLWHSHPKIEVKHE